MLTELDSYNWCEAFEYAVPNSVEGSKCSLASFSREDVAAILHFREGERDGDSWLLIGLLRDGRFFFLTAHCDYTGWD